MKRNHNENIGKVFGKLSILGVERINGYIYYRVKCICGNIKLPFSFSVLSGRTVSCGCYQKEQASKPHNRMVEKIKPNGESSLNYMFLTYKRNAKNRSYIFDLNKEQFRELTKGSCYYCGLPPNTEHKYWTHANVKKKTPYLGNGIDRKNNSLGYTLENCVACCKICNVAKASLSIKEFLQWVKRVFIFNNT